MRIKKESTTKLLKKFVLPEGVEIEAGNYVLEEGDVIFFEAPVIEEDDRKNNIKNFGNKKSEPFKKEGDKEKNKKKEEIKELQDRIKELEQRQEDKGKCGGTPVGSQQGQQDGSGQGNKKKEDEKKENVESKGALEEAFDKGFK